jgi:RNA polymerase sigma factor (sigma-70 family)
MALPQGRGTFDRLVSASLPAALRFAIRLTGRLDTAEEVVQEAMLRATRSWKTFRGESQFNTWILRIVVNAHRDRLGRSPATEDLDNDQPDARQPLPEDLASAAELAEVVAKCVAELPLRQREVLVLSVYERLDAEEIARVLQLNTANVYSTLNVARSKLRERLGTYLAKQ